MTARSAIIKKLRKLISENVDFRFWVRKTINPNVIWVGAEFGTVSRRAILQHVLQSAGYTIEDNGKPGTSGEYIIDVIV